MRLNNALRDKIISAVVREQGLRDKHIAAGEAVLDKLVATHEATYPAGLLNYKPWLSETTRIVLKNAEGYTVEYFDTGVTHLFRQNSETPSVAITPEIQALLDARAAAKKELNDVESMVYVVVYSCTTTKQLIETAPELARFVPDENTPVTALVDMATVNRLRQMLTPK